MRSPHRDFIFKRRVIFPMNALIVSWGLPTEKPWEIINCEAKHTPVTPANKSANHANTHTH